VLENISTYLLKEDYRLSILPYGLHILKYKSILDITDREALIKMPKNTVKVVGTSLKLVTLDKLEVLITGKIKKVEIIEH